MSKTRNELIYQALRNLGSLPLGQDPNDDDFEHVSTLVDVTVDDLRSRDVYFLPDVDSIPNEAYLHLAHCLAWNCAAGFGQHKDTNLYQLAQKAEMDLEKQQAERAYRDVLPIDPY